MPAMRNPERRQNGKQNDRIPKTQHQRPRGVRWETEIAVINSRKIQTGFPRDRRLAVDLDNTSVVWPLVAVKPRATTKQTEVKAWCDSNTVPLHIQAVTDEHGKRQQTTPDARSDGYASAIHAMRATKTSATGA